MSNALRDALNAKRGYDASKNIDSTEVEAVNSAISQIEEMLLGVADTNTTKDTVAIVQVVELMLPSILANLDGATARKQRTAYNSGEELKAGVDPELARKAKLYDEAMDESNPESLQAQLKKLQEAQTGTGPRGLGASSDPVEAAMAKLRPLVEAKPDRVDGLVDLITKTNGVSQNEYNERSALALLIMEGGNDARLGNWKVVDDPNGTHRKPQVLVDALTKVASATKDKDAAEKALKEERDVNKADSLAQKLKNADDAKVTAENAKTTAEKALADEKDESKDGSLAKKLKDAQAATAPANMVDKATVKAKLAKIKTEVGKIKVQGVGRVQNLDKAQRAVGDAETLVQ